MDAKKRVFHNAITHGVSIHAPVMDAKYDCAVLLLVPSFNPRARDGREFVHGHT